ncbi:MULTISPECIES: Panacea domain-containing protein [Geothrix]|uniref:Panacea domain-containing protein n=1 Tax=Geothrix TaxID=44675 RepID=UPI001FAB7C3C|nr:MULTISPECIES: Panacea domain-containing protein [Geothrix]
MNQQVIRDLVRFALAAAARQDHRVDLGPIHLLKLLFLADWAFAQGNSGKTYTGIPWRFHNFGPYCYEAVAEVEDTVHASGVEDRSFLGSKSGREVKRWSFERTASTDELYYDLDRRLPLVVSRAILQTIRTQGSATYPILHEVYSSLPMRCTAPGELINFDAAIAELLATPEPSGPEEESPDTRPVVLSPIDPDASTTQRKKRAREFALLQQRMSEALSRADDSGDLLYIEPLEDEVFEQGVSWLEPQQEALQPFTAHLQIHPSVWHSRTRRSIS